MTTKLELTPDIYRKLIGLGLSVYSISRAFNMTCRDVCLITKPRKKKKPVTVRPPEFKPAKMEDMVMLEQASIRMLKLLTREMRAAQ